MVARPYIIFILVTVLFFKALPSSTAQMDVFESAACQFEIPPNIAVDCGYLNTRDGQRLHVAIFHSFDPHPAPDPVLYLEGGPGYSPLSAVPYVFSGVYAPFLRGRDLIIFDQRGTGFSEPALNCPEIENGASGIFECHDRLTSEGIDLSLYTSVASAADVEALRQELGYREWNIYSTSYGTRLALTVMRDYPEGIRSVILDSTYPLQVNLYLEFPANFYRALQVLFENCAADESCNMAYPDLETVFYEQVRRLNEAPVTTFLSHDNRPVRVTIDGYRLINMVFSALYDPAIIPDLPHRIYAGQIEDYAAMFGLQPPSEAISFSAGLYYALQCNEELPFSAREDYNLESFAPIEVFFQRNAVFGAPMFSICEVWQSMTPDAIENEPVTSDIPTLILAGEYDPITPPAWGILASETLGHSYFYEFNGLGHGVFASHGCPLTMTLHFLHIPTVPPDSSCMDGMPATEFK